MTSGKAKYTITKVEPGDKLNEPRVTIAKDGVDQGVVVIKTISNPEVGCEDRAPEHHDKKL